MTTHVFAAEETEAKRDGASFPRGAWLVRDWASADGGWPSGQGSFPCVTLLTALLVCLPASPEFLVLSLVMRN